MLPRLFQILVYIAIVFLVYGCGGLSTRTTLSNESTKGIVIVSITQKNATQNMFVWIRRVSDHDFVPSVSGNYTITTPKVNVFELEPGEYEFHRWSIVGGNSWGNTKFDKPYRFSVTKGQATYVGNFDFKLMADEKLAWDIVDNRENDINEFKQQFPLINDDRITIAIAKF